MRALLAALLVSGLLLAGCSGSPSEDASDDPATTAPAGSSSAASSQAPSSTGGSAPSGSPPELSVGDFWEHVASGDGYEATTRIEVAALEDHDGVPAYRFEMTVETTVTGTTNEFESTIWVRRSDHASMEEQSSTSFSFGGQTYDSTTTTVYDPPCVDLRWPLAVGATWSETCTSTTTTDGDGETTTETTTYTVEAKETLSVEAGSFETFRVRVDVDGQVTKMWVSEEVCGMVKFEATEQGQTITTELSDYEC